MKVKVLVASLLVAAAPVAFANDAAPAQPVPQTPEAWLQRMTDFTKNMSAYKDPKVFVPWLNAVTEPGFYTTMGTHMMDPANWLNMMVSMTHPGAYTNMAQWADPNIYMKWLAASLDPNFYTAVLTQLTDPGKLMRWAMSPLDPKLWNMALNTLNPNMYLKWMMSPLDPRVLQLMTAPINPNLYMGWLGASMNPASYGDMWAGFMNPANYSVPTFNLPTVPVGTAATPWTVPALPAGTFNPFDPNSWTKLFPAPAAPAAAPASK
ncbi:MAG TPA: hypothetical protein PKH69_01435 [Thiobacillaceae bacterium]|nr:hypothetical protein [Thiobacillaceae bacterium]HNU63222.1 hypothetical protein [Thiobacillaceae bacterium]